MHNDEWLMVTHLTATLARLGLNRVPGYKYSLTKFYKSFKKYWAEKYNE